MKVLISGASGFIGMPIVQALTREGATVAGLSRKCQITETGSKIKWLNADLSQPTTYMKAVKAFAPETLIHLAWSDIPDYSFGKSFTNLAQSLEFMSFVTSLECCRNIIVAGSCWEIEKRKGECKEDEEARPTNDFTWSKNALHSWLEMECKRRELSLKWMRIFYSYGPRQRSASLIPSILDSLGKKELPKIKTPKHSNDFIFVDDIAEAFARAVFLSSPESGIFHLGSGVATPVIEVCRIADDIINGSTEITEQIECECKDSGSTPNFWADCTKIRSSLGWSANTSLREGIEKTWRWMTGS